MATSSDGALSTQVGGDHYKSMLIQPVEFALVNHYNTAQANVIKYVCRYQKKGGAADLKKAHHYCDIWLQVFAAHVLSWTDSPPPMIDVDVFIRDNALPPPVAKIIELVCISPNPQQIEVAKAAIRSLLAGLDG
jgi:hypothetical protein